MTQDNLPRGEISVFLIGLIILGIGFYFLGPTITGFVIRELSHADNLNLVVTSGGNYTWSLKNTGELKSARLDGKITNYGTARIYLESEGARYLIFDSTRLNEANQVESSNNSITGFVAGGKQPNYKPVWKSETSAFFINKTLVVNLSEYFSDKDGGELSYSASGGENIIIYISGELLAISSNANYDFNSTATFIASDGSDSKSQKGGV